MAPLLDIQNLSVTIDIPRGRDPVPGIVVRALADERIFCQVEGACGSHAIAAAQALSAAACHFL